jgi:transcriptional regulator with XRE-family HTH domain
MRKSQSDHPLAKVRIALGKLQKEFAEMFGVSASYIQAIELGQRGKNPKHSAIYDQLCDDIELQLGVRASSLKQEHGEPIVWLLQEQTVALMPQRISAPILSKLRKLRDKPLERLRYQLDLWKKMLPTIEARAPRKQVVEKLLILLDAAAQQRKQLTALSRLDRWIEDQIALLNLRKAVGLIAQKRSQRLGKKPLVLPITALNSVKAERLSRTRRARSRTSVSPRSQCKVVDSA